LCAGAGLAVIGLRVQVLGGRPIQGEEQLILLFCPGGAAVPGPLRQPGGRRTHDCLIARFFPLAVRVLGLVVNAMRVCMPPAHQHLRRPAYRVIALALAGRVTAHLKCFQLIAAPQNIEW